MRLFAILCAAACGWSALAWADAPAFHGPPLDRPVRRVVTLAPSLTQTVEALGAGERLVGVSRYDEGEAVQRLPRVGGFSDPSVEAVVKLAPDLVLVQPGPGNRAPVEKMAELGIPVLALPLHTVAQTLAAIEAVGAALDKKQEAAALVARIQAARAEVRRKSAGLSKKKVLIVYGFAPLVVAGPGSFGAELLADAGGVNVAADARVPYPVYSVERVLAARPDVIIDLADSRTGVQALRALEGLQRARWVRPASQDLLHPGPRLARGLHELFALVHGKDVP